MKWVTALAFGALVGFILPTALDAGSGLWMDSWAGWGTVRPDTHSSRLLFSIPLFLGTALAFRLVFNWHSR